jgi:uncharacterized protein
MKTLLTGATGLIGRELVRSLESAVVLSRYPEQVARRLAGVQAHAWSPEASPPPASVFDGVEVVVNLAGEPVAEGRWTDERKGRIRDSRVLGTRNLVAGLASLAHRPRVLVSASAVGYYGDRGDEILVEASAPGRDFLADVCVAWEREARAAEALGMRVVCVRTGLVLARDGGALARMLTPFRMGMGGRLGDGKQWMPWIHIDDEIGILLHAMKDDRVQGPINAVGPRPVTNAEFTLQLARVLHRPAFLPVPKAALRLAFGEMGEILTASQRVLPKEAERSGYTFKHTELASALAATMTAPADTVA